MQRRTLLLGGTALTLAAFAAGLNWAKYRTPHWADSLGSTGFRIFGGRMGWFDNTVPKTFQTTAELPIPGFKRIRLVLASSATEPVAVGGAGLASMANTTDINASSVTHFKATFDGKESGVIPASPTAWRRSYLFSDWIDLASEERNDGGQRPVVVGRVFIPTSGQISVLGNGGSDDYRNWSDRRDGALWAMRFQDGNCCGGTGRPETFASSIPQSLTQNSMCNRNALRCAG